MKTYDIYCDASVGSNLRGACAGALVTERYGQTSYMQACIQPDGTNNSGEICAILLGVTNAINIMENSKEDCRFNIFSDSIIGIRGVREWIFHWIANANRNGNNVFVNSSGEPVSNQVYFKLIFNNIILRNLDAHFYHQRGHVTSHYENCASTFAQTNGINLMRLGLTAERISLYNNHVDNITREILRTYLRDNKLTMDGISFDNMANTELEAAMASGIAIPKIDVLDAPSTQFNQEFAILDGKQIIKKYATLIHADEYPSKYRISKYIS